MKCPRCQHENRPGAKFCEECATPLARACPSCGATVYATAKFCPECAHPVGAPATTQPRFTSPDSYTPRHLAEKILTSKSTLEGERKQVTVLFADISGFTPLAGQLDPEDVHQLMNQAFELMLAEVHRYEGTVNQFLGDGIMALFGAPIAHEDNAQRAIHAALGIRKALDGYRSELQRKHGTTFQVRQGLNTGLVVVGSIGSDLRMDYTAVGDTTNVAARLQQSAEPGSIVISAGTHRVVNAYFHVRPLGELLLKGKPEPVRAWEVISARLPRTRLEVEAERGLTPLVGRDRELQHLFECFGKVMASQAQVVFISGEPGIGKSRLLLEFRRRIGADATWLEGHCMPFARSIAFHPLIDLLKRNFRIEEGDAEATIVKKIQRGVLLLGEDLRPIVPSLRYLLSVDPGDPSLLDADPQQRRREIFDGLRRLTVRAAEVRPQVFVFEDLQWMDKATEEYLLFAADSITASRALLILTYRTGYVQPLGERTYYSRIALNALSTEESVRMAHAVLATEGLPEDLKALIVRKAEGNPFFLEEVIKSLREVGAIRRAEGRYVMSKPLHEIVVPDTIQDVIMARIDRLEEASKRVLQFASVIGREFTRRLLDRIADIRGRTEELLRELKAAELIYEKTVFPELAYTFKHALTHEVAYNSLLLQRRKELHRAIGVAIESLYADRLAEHYEMLGYHFSKGEEWSKAPRYLRQAGAKAAAHGANREAVTHFEQALVALAHLPEDRETVEQAVDVRFDLRNSLLLLGEFGRTLEYLQEADTLAHALGDRRRLGEVSANMTHYFRLVGEPDRAIACGQDALSLARAAGDFTLSLKTNLVLGQAYLALGAYPQAIDCFRQCMTSVEGERRYERFGQPAIPSVVSRTYLIWSLAERGEFAEGIERGDEVVRIAESVAHSYSLIFAYFALGALHLRQGDLDKAMGVLERALVLCQGGKFPILFPTVASHLGYAYALGRRVADALPLLEEAVAQGVAMKLLFSHSLRVAWLAEAHLLAGRTEDASRLATRALSLSREHKERAHEAWILRLFGEIAAHHDSRDVETPGGHYRAALARGTELGMRPLVAHCHLGLGTLYLRAGQRARGHQHLGLAISTFREMDMRFWREKAEAEVRAAGGADADGGLTYGER